LLDTSLQPGAASPAATGTVSAGTEIIRLFSSSMAWLTHLQPRAAAINIALSLLIVAAAFGLLRLADLLMRRGVERLAAKGLVSDQEARGGPRVAGFSRALIRLAIVVAGLVLVLEVWGLAPLEWVNGSTGAALGRAVLLVTVGAAAVEIGGRMIDRLFAGLQHRARDARRAAQFRTLAPIVRGLAIGLLVIFLGLTVLSEIGVKIGPLLAGAGVVGVALGFGAQTLVKDFLTGLFLIMEDIVSVGDNVTIGTVGGLVETMTLRTIRLRDYDGTLHVFPYSEAQVIHNRTKTFSYAVVAPRISYVSDIEKARAIMETVAEELRSDPAFGGMIQERLDIAGVDEFTDVGVALKARFRTDPGSQWKIAREFRERLKLAFDKEGVEIGYPNLPADRAIIPKHDAEQETPAQPPPRPEREPVAGVAGRRGR
jgi:small-conductance mechanosensitive channel